MSGLLEGIHMRQAGARQAPSRGFVQGSLEAAKASGSERAAASNLDNAKRDRLRGCRAVPSTPPPEVGGRALQKKTSQALWGALAGTVRTCFLNIS